MFERYEYLKFYLACLLVLPRYVKANVLDELNASHEYVPGQFYCGIQKLK